METGGGDAGSTLVVDAAVAATTTVDSRDEDRDRIKQRDIFVGNLSLFTDNAKLRGYFQTFGAVEDVRIMYHPETGRSRRFGFITFVAADLVKKVMSHSGGHFLDGKKLDVKHAFKRVDELHMRPRAPSRKMHVQKASKQVVKIFVGGVGQDVKNDDVRDYFSQYGKVESATLIPDSITGRHRGFGFVQYASVEAVGLVCSVR